MATASLLPLPRAVFYDANGAPLAGGFVYTYVPGGSTPKTTWQDTGETTPNSNPIALDLAGSCLLYGSGSYQITVTDSLGNAVPGYSGLSADTTSAVFVNGGTFAADVVFGGTGNGVQVTNNATISGTLGIGTNLSVAGTMNITNNGTVGGTLGVGGILQGSSAAFSGAVSVGAPTASTDAVQLSQVGSPGRVAIFTNSGTWTCPSGITLALVTAVGGGGGGGGGGPNNSGGGGGGSGQVVYRQSTTVVPTTVYTVTIGGAGAGGSASTAGAAGTISSFGTLVTAAGGSGGALGVTSTLVLGGAAGGGGGSAGGAGSGNSATALGGMGGGNAFGAGGAGGVVQNTLSVGQNAGGFGAGGGGASATAAGGNGAPGLVIVEF